ncbi:MAG: hypothetical protein M3R55_12805 [Acidobacteriota bacterium]|nr:hypothetical protein [Acidobacteriota bacterium]MDQ3169793.1 hypothetical protein [Acidobacteriota bacterium]
MKALSAFVCAAVVSIASVAVMAHQETFKGKVLSIEKTSVRVNVVDPKTRKATPKTFKTGAKTKMLRGDTVVTWAAAKIRADENIAVTVDHDADVSMALVIRLDAAK